MVAAQSGPFDEAGVLATAQAAEGLSDFGDDEFREPLSVLLRALDDAPLSEMGVGLMRGGILQSLVTRLRAQYWLARHPEIADEQIQAPIVVVGMMRSGTTLIQRVLASDPRHYCVLGWEVSEPAPRLDWDWATADPRVADAETRDEQMRVYAADLYAIHPMDAHQAEEEIMFFADAFLSHVPEASANVPAYRAWLDTADFQPAYDHLHRMLQLLQWQKRRQGEDRGRWVLKTPAHLGYLDTLIATFPDAHIVHMHRDPVDVIASGASLNTALWRMNADDVDPTEVGRQWIERMAWTNGRALASRDRMPDESTRVTDLWFRDAVRDPIGQIRRIYDAVGLDLTLDAHAAMQAWLDAYGTQSGPTHKYTPEDFGLSADEIRGRFADYIVRFVSPHSA